MNDKKLSYTSVKGAFPLKVVKDGELLKSIDEGKIIPIHPKINITNVCNLACPFCSRADVDRTLIMDYVKIYETAEMFKHLGAKAITLSGGGEPLTHPRINDIVKTITDMGMEVGLLTNGWLLNKLTEENLNKFTWIRVSSGDGREEGEEYWTVLKEVVKKGKDVDWGLSYVLGINPDFDLIKTVVNFGNENGCTHIRLMSDLSIEDNSIAEAELKKFFKDNVIDDGLISYQDSPPTRGCEKCVIGLLKPVVDTDGTIYPCCNTQFAVNSNGDRNWLKEMSLGNTDNIIEIYSEQKVIDGRKCRRCFSSHYNELLNLLSIDVKHRRFV